MKEKFIIKKAFDFDNIINNGKKEKGSILSICYYPSADNKYYFGFAVGKKHGNAVERNKIKRKLRMIVSQHQNLFSNKYKYIIMIRKDCLSYSHQEWENDLLTVIEKVNNSEKI